ncbi:MAG TPA: xanthine dehydrogenase family protein molybdopterin-binding subunit [Candidatus Sulfotelmatobacter sp.]|nr:xanthine dehydrogenase family protein molybdopterin-binding subunit [Candidatus Sulfotelmatobacter sp.]
MSVTTERPHAGPYVGASFDRVDGGLKVRGEAHYTADTPADDLLHGVLVQSRIARGRIASLDDSAARAVPGVIEVMTYRNAPRVKELPFDFAAPMTEALAPLQDERIRYDGQHVALVIGETYEAARDAAALVAITYASEPAVTALDAASEIERPAEWFGSPSQVRRGDPDGAFARAAVQLDERYTTPTEHHVPMEPSATLAYWQGANLVVHDATQYVVGTRGALAAAFEIPLERVHVICPFIGGGFGCKGFFWAHSLIAAMAARLTGQPVKVVLAREQTFTSHGYRTETQQRIRVGATREGKLEALLHDVRGVTSRVGMFVESAGRISSFLYDCPNVAIAHEVAPLDVPTPTAMRAPGEAPGTFALGSALDELAYACGLDPLEVLRRNHSTIDADEGVPYSSKHLLECYARGADRFGWSSRSRAPRSMRDGHEYVGWGVATATYPALSAPAQARLTIDAQGIVEVASATHDLGTGMYTILTQIAADALGVAPTAVRVRIGDSAFPPAPVAGGSMSSASVGPAVLDAARRAREEAIAIATRSGDSPLFGYDPRDVHVNDGVLHGNGGGARMAYADVVRLSGTAALEVVGASTPPGEGRYAFQSFGAQFVEVRFDPELARLRVSRVVGAFDCGRILNAKTARSQMLGGIVWGIGMALLEETIRDPRTGAVVSDNLADYHVPVNADVHDIDVVFVEEPDLAFNPLGVRGIGEIGITGVAAAIANAVYHATGVRVRDLPILPEKLLVTLP